MTTNLSQTRGLKEQTADKKTEGQLERVSENKVISPHSEQRKSSWSISEGQLSTQQDLPSGRDISQDYDYKEIPYTLMTKRVSATNPYCFRLC